MALRIWNPFKPHIAKVTDSEAYVVRKLTIFGWVYKDVTDNGWWKSKESVIKWCIHFRPESAAEACYSKKKPFARLYAY